MLHPGASEDPESYFDREQASPPRHGRVAPPPAFRSWEHPSSIQHWWLRIALLWLACLTLVTLTVPRMMDVAGDSRRQCRPATHLVAVRVDEESDADRMSEEYALFDKAMTELEGLADATVKELTGRLDVVRSSRGTTTRHIRTTKLPAQDAASAGAAVTDEAAWVSPPQEADCDSAIGQARRRLLACLNGSVRTETDDKAFENDWVWLLPTDAAQSFSSNSPAADAPLQWREMRVSFERRYVDGAEGTAGIGNLEKTVVREVLLGDETSSKGLLLAGAVAEEMMMRSKGGALSPLRITSPPEADVTSFASQTSLWQQFRVIAGHLRAEMRWVMERWPLWFERREPQHRDAKEEGRRESERDETEGTSIQTGVNDVDSGAAHTSRVELTQEERRRLDDVVPTYRSPFAPNATVHFTERLYRAQWLQLMGMPPVPPS